MPLTTIEARLLTSEPLTKKPSPSRRHRLTKKQLAQALRKQRQPKKKPRSRKPKAVYGYL